MTDETVPGFVQCHSSEDDGTPDVGVSVGLGNGRSLWLGELLTRDGGDIGFIVHGPDGQRDVAAMWPDCEWQDAVDLLRQYVGPAIAQAHAVGRAEGLEEAAKVADNAAATNLKRSDELRQSRDEIDVEYSVAFHRKYGEASTIATAIRARAALAPASSEGEGNG